MDASGSGHIVRRIQATIIKHVPAAEVPAVQLELEELYSRLSRSLVEQQRMQDHMITQQAEIKAMYEKLEKWRRKCTLQQREIEDLTRKLAFAEAEVHTSQVKQALEKATKDKNAATAEAERARKLQDKLTELEKNHTISAVRQQLSAMHEAEKQELRNALLQDLHVERHRMHAALQSVVEQGQGLAAAPTIPAMAVPSVLLSPPPAVVPPPPPPPPSVPLAVAPTGWPMSPGATDDPLTASLLGLSDPHAEYAKMRAAARPQPRKSFVDLDDPRLLQSPLRMAAITHNLPSPLSVSPSTQPLPSSVGGTSGLGMYRF